MRPLLLVQLPPPLLRLPGWAARCLCLPRLSSSRWAVANASRNGAAHTHRRTPVGQRPLVACACVTLARTVRARQGGCALFRCVCVCVRLVSPCVLPCPIRCMLCVVLPVACVCARSSGCPVPPLAGNSGARRTQRNSDTRTPRNEHSGHTSGTHEQQQDRQRHRHTDTARTKQGTWTTRLFDTRIGIIVKAWKRVK